MFEEMREILRGLEHVAALAEHHEGAGGGHILESDAPAEFVARGRQPAGAADLHGECVSAPESSRTCAMLTPNGYS